MITNRILFAESGATMPLFPFFQYGSYLLDAIFSLIAVTMLVQLHKSISRWGLRTENQTEMKKGGWSTPDNLPPKNFLDNQFAFLSNIYLIIAFVPFLFGFFVTVLSRYQNDRFKEPEYWTLIFGFITSLSIIFLYTFCFKTQIDGLLKYLSEYIAQFDLNNAEFHSGKIDELEEKNKELENQLKDFKNSQLPLEPVNLPSSEGDAGSGVRMGLRPPC